METHNGNPLISSSCYNIVRRVHRGTVASGR